MFSRTSLPTEVTVTDSVAAPTGTDGSFKLNGVPPNTYSLAVTAPHVAIPALLQFLQKENRQLARLTTRHASLEDVFVTLTGRHLREEEPSSA